MFGKAADAMELTPSPASLSSSKKNQNGASGINVGEGNTELHGGITTLGASQPGSALDHVKSPIGGQNPFQPGFNFENQGHMPPNTHNVASLETSVKAPKHERPNSMELQEPRHNGRGSNIHVVEQYQYTGGQSSGNNMSGREAQSARFRRTEPQMGFDELKFDQIDQEEALLDEQYRQLSQHHRAAARLPVTNASQSGLTSAARTGNVTALPTGMQVSKLGSQRSDLSAHAGQTVQPAMILGSGALEDSLDARARTQQFAAQAAYGIDSNRREHGSQDYGSNHSRQVVAEDMAVSSSHQQTTVHTNTQNPVSGSQQSLIDRDTSPFNRRATSHSDLRGGNGELPPVSSAQVDIRGRAAEPAGVRAQNRSLSGGSAGNYGPGLAMNEQNFRRLQAKVQEQAQRLLQAKNQSIQSNIPLDVKSLELRLADKDRTIKMLQQRNIELSQSLSDFQDIPARIGRLQTALETEQKNLSAQKLQNKILKDSVQTNLERLGLRSQSSQDGRRKRKAVDLYLELVQTKDDYQKLKEKLDETLNFVDTQKAAWEKDKRLSEATHKELVGFLKQEHGAQMVDKETRIRELQAERAKLLDDGRALQERGHDVEKQLYQAQNKADLDANDRRELAAEKGSLEQKVSTLDQRNADQEQLIRQAKDNLHDMRVQRESLQTEVQDLKQQNDDLTARVESSTREVNECRKQIDELNRKIESQQLAHVDRQIHLKERAASAQEETEQTKQRLRDFDNAMLQKDELIYKQQETLAEQRKKIEALEDTREQLKKTLRESQAELVNLVNVHERLTQQKNIKTNDVLQLSQESEELKSQLLKKKALLADYQERLNGKEKELREAQKQLADRNRQHLDNERQFLQSLKDREQEQQDLQKKLLSLQEELSDRSIKIDYLQKMRDEQRESEALLRASIEQRQRECDGLTQEMRQTKAALERQSSEMESTMLQDQVQKQHAEMRLTQEIERLQADCRRLRDERDTCEEQLREQVRNLKSELAEERSNRSVQQSSVEFSGRQGRNSMLVEGGGEELSSARSLADARAFQAALLSSFSKFASQMARVKTIDTEPLYEHLSKLTKEHVKLQKADQQEFDRKVAEKLLAWHKMQQKSVQRLVLDREKARHAIVESSFDAQLDLIQRDKIPEKEDSSTTDAGETNESQDLKQVKEAKDMLERGLNQLSLLTCLKNEIRQSILEFMERVRSVNSIRSEQAIISRKLSFQEARYVQLQAETDRERRSSATLYKSELVHLRQQIDRDRSHLASIEKRLEDANRAVESSLQALARLDTSMNRNEQSSRAQVLALTEQLTELRKNYNDASSKRDWAEARLAEINSQMQSFDAPPISTMMSGRRFSGRRASSGLMNEQRVNMVQASVKTQKNHLLPPMAQQYTDGKNERISLRMRSNKAGEAQAPPSQQNHRLGDISEQKAESSRLYVRKFSELGTEPAMVVNDGRPIRSGVASSMRTDQPSVTIVNQRVAASLERERSPMHVSTTSPTVLVAPPHMQSVDQSAFPQSHFAQELQKANRLPRSLSNENARGRSSGSKDRSEPSQERSDRLSNVLKAHQRPVTATADVAAEPTMSVRNLLMEKLGHVQVRPEVSDMMAMRDSELNNILSDPRLTSKEATLETRELGSRETVGVESSFHKEVDVDYEVPVETKTNSGQQVWTRDVSYEQLNMPRISPSTANQYKRSVSPAPRDTSGEGRPAPNEILSDSLGGLTPNMPPRATDTNQQRQYMSYLQSSDVQQPPMSADIDQFKNMQNHVQPNSDGSYEAEPYSIERQNMPPDLKKAKVYRTQQSDADRQNFQMMTKGNHLLPLQVRQPTTEATHKSYVQTNEEVLRSQMPLQPANHSPILSYVQTNRDGAVMNLDFVDQQRLLRELSPEERAAKQKFYVGSNSTKN